MPKQPHTEEAVKHTENQQDTGNHMRPGTPEAANAGRLGGTRKGAGNVEQQSAEGIEKPGDTGQGAHQVERIIEPHERKD